MEFGTIHLQGERGIARKKALGCGVSQRFLGGIAAVPCGIWGDWFTLHITTTGIVLAFPSESLSQWKTEKWSCRRNAKAKDVVRTRGKSVQHAIVIRDPDAVGFDLEDLAGG
jgi:hypothetical protein